MRAYQYLSYTGLTFLGLIALIPIISYLMTLVHTIQNDQEALGYIVLFFTLPALGIAAFIGGIAGASGFFLFMSFKQNKGKMLCIHVGVFLVTLALPFLYQIGMTYILSLTFSGMGIFPKFVENLQSGDLHPANLLYGFYFIGPIFILLGGLFGYIQVKDFAE